MNTLVVTHWISPSLCREPASMNVLINSTKRYRRSAQHSTVIRGLIPRVAIESGLYHSLWEQRLIQGVSIKLMPKVSSGAIQRAFRVSEAGMEVVDCIVE